MEHLQSTTLGTQTIRCPNGATLQKSYGWAVINRGRYALHIFRSVHLPVTWYTITNHERWILHVEVRD
jgi:hypothetical protein